MEEEEEEEEEKKEDNGDIHVYFQGQPHTPNPSPTYQTTPTATPTHRRLLNEAGEDGEEALAGLLRQAGHSALHEVQAQLEQLSDGRGIGGGSSGRDVLLMELLNDLQEESLEPGGEGGREEGERGKKWDEGEEGREKYRYMYIYMYIVERVGRQEERRKGRTRQEQQHTCTCTCNMYTVHVHIHVHVE